MRKVLGSCKFLVPSEILIIQWHAQPVESSHGLKCQKMHLFKRTPCIENTYPDTIIIYLIYKRHAVPCNCSPIRRIGKVSYFTYDIIFCMKLILYRWAKIKVTIYKQCSVI